MTNIILNGTSAVQIQQVAASGFSLQNIGPGTVYLDNNASVTPSTGYLVPPGLSLPLNANTVLYACTDNGQFANLQLLQGATATQATIVEANIPGAITVTGNVNATITNASIPVTGSVNANITNATINTNITNATIPVSGSVNANITNATLAVAGNVNVAGSVSITNATLPVSGNVNANITNATITTSTTVTNTVNTNTNITNPSITIAGSVNANITNATITTNTNITNATVPVSGSVSATITNASLTVAGSVNANITNATINTNTNITNASIPVTGSVSITSGSVAIASGNVTVNGTVGNQPGVGLTLLGTATVNYTTAAGSLGIISGTAPYPDCSAYSSLLIVIQDGTNGTSSGFPSAANIGNWMNLSVTIFSDNTGSFPLDTYKPQWLVTGSNVASLPCGSLQVPIRGGNWNIAGTVTKLATATGGTLTAKVYGSHEVLTETRYESFPTQGTPTGAPILSAVSAATDTIIGSKNGPAVMNVLGGTSSSTGSANVQYMEGGAWNVFDGTGNTLAAGGHTSTPLNLPMRPILLHVAPTAGSLFATIQQPN